MIPRRELYEAEEKTLRVMLAEEEEEKEKERRENERKTQGIEQVNSCGYVYTDVRFSKLSKTFRARKAISCAGCIPKQIQFSFVLKAKQ